MSGMGSLRDCYWQASSTHDWDLAALQPALIHDPANFRCSSLHPRSLNIRRRIFSGDSRSMYVHICALQTATFLIGCGKILTLDHHLTRNNFGLPYESRGSLHLERRKTVVHWLKHSDPIERSISKSLEMLVRLKKRMLAQWLAPFEQLITRRWLKSRRDVICTPAALSMPFKIQSILFEPRQHCLWNGFHRNELLRLSPRASLAFVYNSFLSAKIYHVSSTTSISRGYGNKDLIKGHAIIVTSKLPTLRQNVVTVLVTFKKIQAMSKRMKSPIRSPTISVGSTLPN